MNLFPKLNFRSAAMRERERVFPPSAGLRACLTAVLICLLLPAHDAAAQLAEAANVEVSVDETSFSAPGTATITLSSNDNPRQVDDSRITSNLEMSPYYPDLLSSDNSNFKAFVDTHRIFLIAINSSDESGQLLFRRQKVFLRVPASLIPETGSTTISLILKKQPARQQPIDFYFNGKTSRNELTLRFLVGNVLRLRIKVYLEGALR